MTWGNHYSGAVMGATDGFGMTGNVGTLMASWLWRPLLGTASASLACLAWRAIFGDGCAVAFRSGCEK